RDTDDGDERDDGNKRPFGPQVAQREEQFKRQFRHEGRLNVLRWSSSFSLLAGTGLSLNSNNSSERIALCLCFRNSRQKKLAQEHIDPAQHEMRRENESER